MAIATKSYNPGFLTDSELMEIFCVRLGEFESLIETVRENTGSSNQHAIVVGPRGSGKTTLLLRVALEIQSNPELSSRLHPIVFAEESYGVSTCGEFWLECLSRLAEQVPRRDGEPDLQRTVDEVRKERNDRSLRERCLGAVVEFADREGKRLVLVAENLNMMFSEMKDSQAEWCLRKTLQTEPRIMMIGSATSRFGEIDRPDRALFDLFRILQLHPLDRDESVALCERVSGKSLKRRAARRLQILTGGSPRLLTIMARFGAAQSFHNLMADLLTVVDEHTAYFKSHLESLPAQERRVYLALAALWKPATAREVADRARMDTSKCSAQLKRLIGRGVVTDAGGTSRRRLYYVSERLYNIYHLLRQSRGKDGLAQALVEFMDAYYSKPELEGLVDRMVADVATVDMDMQAVYQVAFAQLGTRSAVAWHLFEKYPDYLAGEVKDVTSDSRALLDQASEKSDRRDHEGALEILDDLIRKYGETEATTVRDTVATALVKKGLILALQARNEDAIVAFDEAIHRLESTAIPGLRDWLANALLGRAGCLRWMDRIQEAIAACDHLIGRFHTDESAAMAEAVAMALLVRGTMHGNVGQAEQELQSYTELECRFGSSESIPVLVSLANALVLKAGRLYRMGRGEESIVVCEALTKRFGDDTSSRFLEPVGKAMIIRSAVLGTLGRIREQRSACDQAMRWLDWRDRLAYADDAPGHDEIQMLGLRLMSHEMRMLACIKLGDHNSAVRDLRAVLGIVPRLDATPTAAIKYLMVASLAFGFDQMAKLIRESPSADRLLPLTTALELEMGLDPRVAIEVREVAKDIRRNLARLRQQYGIDPKIGR